MHEQSNPRALAASMRERRQSQQEPYILLIGRACARAAGVTLESVARNILRQVDRSILPVSPDEPDSAKLIDGFRSFLNQQDEETREYILRSDADSPIPVFYQDLASLIKTGYFRQILTTSVDRMLELCLWRKGWEEGEQYQVIRIAPGLKIPDWRPESDRLPVTILKLHGDIGKPEFIGSTDMIQEALEHHYRLVNRKLTGDLVSLGYECECEPLMDWLRKAPGEEIWFVHENEPNPDVRGQLEASGRHVHIVSGPDAEPGLCLAHLYDALIDNPRDTTGSLDTLRARALEGQRRRGGEVLRRLEHYAADVPDSYSLNAQITRQRVDVGSLESAFASPGPAESAKDLDINKYLSNRSVPSEIPALLTSVEQSVRQSSMDPSVTKIFTDQIDNISRQIQTGRNPELVHRMLASLASIGESVGDLSSETKGLLRTIANLRVG